MPSYWLRYAVSSNAMGDHHEQAKQIGKESKEVHWEETQASLVRAAW
jgi:hypothetical protein